MVEPSKQERKEESPKLKRMTSLVRQHQKKRKQKYYYKKIGGMIVRCIEVRELHSLMATKRGCWNIPSRCAGI